MNFTMMHGSMNVKKYSISFSTNIKNWIY